MITIPPYLKKGDTIGIICPAGHMPYEKAQTAITVLQEWGFMTKCGPTLGARYNYFSGTDEERLNDLQKMLDDDSVKAILCARGGYGVGRIIDKISFKNFRKNPKWIIGFSDITILHSHIFSNYKIASMHAPMAAAFNDGQYKNDYVQSFRNTISGVKSNYKCSAHPYNNRGSVTARLVGGNLSLLAHLQGTNSEVKTKNKILFIEDVGEYIYNIDRMMFQLKRGGQLENLAALIVGGFTQMRDTDVPFGQTAEEVIRDSVQEYDYPVCFNFPVSHEKENYALKIGMKYKLDVGKSNVTLKEVSSL
jgi:Uncharacterized proteins, homologs of microcin C7 resistance protein MccF